MFGPNTRSRSIKVSEVQVPQFMPILDDGAHSDPKDGACVMEYVSFISGQYWTDRPDGVHPMLAEFARDTNDRLEYKDRQQLLGLIPRLMHTDGVPALVTELEPRLMRWLLEQTLPELDEKADFTEKSNIERILSYLDEHLAGHDDVHAPMEAMYDELRKNASRSGDYAPVSYNVLQALCYALDHPDEPWCILGEFFESAVYAVTRVIAYDRIYGTLVGFIDEYDRLTGRSNDQPPLDAETLQRCAELTKR